MRLTLLLLLHLSLVCLFQAADKKVRTTETEVYVIAAQKGMVEERLKLCNALWDANVKVGSQLYQALMGNIAKRLWYMSQVQNCRVRISAFVFLDFLGNCMFYRLPLIF